MKKTLLSLTALATIVSPVITVVACSTKKESGAQHQLNKIDNLKKSKYTVQGLKDHLKSFNEDQKITLDQIGVEDSENEVDEDWIVNYFITKKSLSYAENELSILAEVVNKKDQTQKAKKEIKISPNQNDDQSPIINLPTTIDNQTIQWEQQKGNLLIRPNANLSNNDVENLFEVQDNSGETLVLSFTWTKDGQPWSGENFELEGNYELKISAVDSSNQKSEVILNINVSENQNPIINIDSSSPLGANVIMGNEGENSRLELAFGSNLTEEDIEALFSWEDDYDQNLQLNFDWIKNGSSTTFNHKESGTYILTATAQDSEAGESNLSLEVIVGENQKPNIIFDTNSLIGSSTINEENGNYTLDLPFGSNVESSDIERLISVEDDATTDVLLTFSWKQNSQTVTFDPNVSGAYALFIEADDLDGEISTASLTVNVKKENLAPTISADTSTPLGESTISGQDNAYTLNLIYNSGVNADQIEQLFSVADDHDDDLRLTFKWTKGDQEVTFDDQEEGIYTLTISVSDTENKTTTAILVVTVQENQWPIIDVDTTTEIAGSKIEEIGVNNGVINFPFGSNATAEEIENLFSAHDFESGDIKLQSKWTMNGEDTTFLPTKAGEYVLNIGANDGYGGLNVYLLSVNVAENKMPVISIDTSALVGDQSIIDINGSEGTLDFLFGADVKGEDIEKLFTANDPELGSLKPEFTWTKNGDTTTFSSEEAGTYLLVVSASDIYELSQSYSLTVIVQENQAPVLNVDTNTQVGDQSIIDVEGSEGTLDLLFGADVKGEDIEKLFTANDPELGSLKPEFTWTKNNQTTTFSSEEAGTYLLVVSANDIYGLSKSYYLTIMVQENQAPVLNVNTSALEGGQSIIDINGSEGTLDFLFGADVKGEDIEKLFTANDPELGSLKPEFTWTKNGDTTTFSSKIAGTYLLVVNIDDTYGLSKSYSLTIKVATNQPPKIVVDTTTVIGNNSIVDNNETGLLTLSLNSGLTTQDITDLFQTSDHEEGNVELIFTWADNLVFNPSEKGTYVLEIEAKDQGDARDTYKLIISVEDRKEV